MLELDGYEIDGYKIFGPELLSEFVSEADSCTKFSERLDSDTDNAKTLTSQPLV